MSVEPLTREERDDAQRFWHVRDYGFHYITSRRYAATLQAAEAEAAALRDALVWYAGDNFKLTTEHIVDGEGYDDIIRRIPALDDGGARARDALAAHPSPEGEA